MNRRGDQHQTIPVRNQSVADMDKLCLYDSTDAIPLYNCSERRPEEWSLETGISRPVTGYLQITYGVFVDFLNLLLIRIFSEESFFKVSCFKIMLLLAIIDFLIIPINSILTGFLSIKGAVFCTYPLLLYITGSMALALWCSSCFTALLLVCNRLLTVTKPSLDAVIFTENRTLLFLVFPIIYGVCFLFTPPHVFNSKYGAWFFDPMIYPNKSEEYTHVAHTVNNMLIVALTCVLYIPFQSAVRTNLKMVNTQTSNHHQAKLQVLLQSTLICVVNQTCAIIYVVMNIVTVPPCIVMFGHFLWQFIHGAPAFIYLLFNQTIQKRFLEMFRIRRKQETTSNVVDTHMPSGRQETLNM